MGISKKSERAEKKPRGRPPKTRYIYINNKMDYVKKVEELRLEGNIAENWKRFRQNFEIFATAIEMNKKAEAVQIAIFLNAVGQDAVDAFNAFNLSAEDKQVYAKVVQAFEDFCKPKQNEVYESFVFHTRNQSHKEPFNNYLMDIKKSVKRCNFKDEDRMLRDRIVLGVQDKGLQKKLLETENLTLQKAIELARAAEITSEQLTVMQGSSSSSSAVDVINKNRQGSSKENLSRHQQRNQVSQQENTNKNQSNSRQDSNNRKPNQKITIGAASIDCGYCGGNHVKGNCPAFGKKCNKCNGNNHFARVCRTKKIMHEVKCVTNQEVDSDNSFYIDSIERYKPAEQNAWFETVKIENQFIKFKLDTGAQVNVLPIKYLKKDKCREIRKNEIYLEAYNSSKIETVGTIELRCVSKNSVSVQQFFIIDENTTPILGLKGCLDLGLIKRIDNLTAELKKNFVSRHRDVFQGLGCFCNNFHIELKENCKAVAKPPRRVPLSLREPLKIELERLCKLEIIEPVHDACDWVSNIVIVEKPNKNIRICLDPRDLNLCIKENYYEIPSFDQVKTKLSNKSIFTVLDLKDGYWQVGLDAYSKTLCTFATPFGCFRFKRLPFGIKIAPEVFQKMNESNFGDIPCVTIYIDDLIIATSNETEHDKILEMVMKRAKERNIKFNLEKMQYKISEVRFLGHKISEQGIAIEDDRVEAIKRLKAPETKKELQKLLGFINYVREYVPNLAEQSTPLRELLKKNTSFQWLECHEKSLQNIKELIVNAPILKAFDEKQKIVIQTDASTTGLGCCLMQNKRPVSFASRSLNNAERNYSQIEKELLAIVFACTKWHTLIYGREIEIVTDHKPLLGIISKEYHKIPSPKLQRMKLRLEKYRLKLTYLPGKFVYLADLLSRNTGQVNNKEGEIKGMNELIHSINVSPSKKQLFQEETKRDIDLRKLLEIIKHGWPQNKNKLPENLRSFWKYRNNLTVEDNLVFFDNRIFIPTKLRESVLHNLHRAHLGIEKTKQRARTLIFWPGLNQEIENMITKCGICQKFQSSNIKEPLINHEIPGAPFQKIGMDLMEVMGSTYLVVGDYYSKYLDIILLNSKTAKAIINKLENIFSIFGIPKQIIADNAPFGSYEFKKFADNIDVEVITSSPIYPKSNGFAERLVQVAKKLILKCKEDKSSLWVALLEYRNTPIKNSKLAPTELIMGRQTRTLLPGKNSHYNNERLSAEIMPTLQKNNKENKTYYDKHAKYRQEFNKGEKVWVQNTSDKQWVPGHIKDKHSSPRSYWVSLKTGSTLRRNALFLRPRK